MAATTSPRSDAGFWSSAKTFFLPVGAHIDREVVRGYPIDLRVKARLPAAPDERFWAPGALHVAVTQHALACYEHWIAGAGEQWLHIALTTGRRLAAGQAADGAWYHEQPFPHTFRLAPPWASAIAQGQAASLFVRLHRETGEDSFAHAARQALAPLDRTQAAGGVQGELGGRPWPEEYPTKPESHVLNGAIFALWGMRDVAVALGSEPARRRYEDHLASLVDNLHRYDTGSWSLYSLFPHPISNRASSFYHTLHVNQLTALELMSPRPEFTAMRERWAGYAASPRSRRMAFAWKAAFRVIVPRSPRLARALPWSPLVREGRAGR